MFANNGNDERVNNHPYFIVRPISLQQQVKIDNRPSLKDIGDGPKIAVTVGSSKFCFQCPKFNTKVVEMLNLLDKFMVKQKYVQFRPQCPIKGKAKHKKVVAFRVQRGSTKLSRGKEGNAQKAMGHNEAQSIFKFVQGYVSCQ